MTLRRAFTTTITAITLSCTASFCLAEGLDLAAIQAKAAQMKQANALLNDPDSNTRLAALDALLNSDDLAMREAAYSAGLASADDAVRAITARKRFTELKSIVIQLELPEKATEAQKKIYDRVGGSYTLSPETYDFKTGIMELRKGDKDRIASVSGITFSFTYSNYSAKFTMDDESAYVGTFTYNGSGTSGSIPAKFTIQ